MDQKRKGKKGGFADLKLTENDPDPRHQVKLVKEREERKRGETSQVAEMDTLLGIKKMRGAGMKARKTRLKESE